MNKALRILTVVLITALGVSVIAAISSRASSNDYIEYWSAGKLFLQGSNPYSPAMTLVLEKSHGFIPNEPLIMLNPPWAMLIVAPLGLVPSFWGLVLWILAAAGCIAASIYLVGLQPKYRILAFLFTPVIATFSMEQVSPFLLLGLALFLRFHRSRPFLAGASLALMTIKPHLFLVFWLVLLIDCLYRRTFALLAGLATALACASALVTIRVPHIWQDYLSLIRGSALDHNFYPTLSSLLRVAIDVKLAWLALLPSCAAIVWGLVFYWRRRTGWDWNKDGMLVMLTTVLTSPYGWISDQVVLLPAIASAISFRPRRFSMEILTAINFAALFAVTVNSQLTIWMPFTWLVWYVYAVGRAMDGDSGRGAMGADKIVLADQTSGRAAPL